MSTPALPHADSRTVALKVGLICAGIMALLTVLGAVLMLRGDSMVWDAVSISVVAVNMALVIATLVLLVPDWHGHRSAAISVAILQILLLLPAFPAFFQAGDPDVEATGGMVAASIATLLAVGSVVLIALGLGRKR